MEHQIGQLLQSNLLKNGETGLFECWAMGCKTDFPNWLTDKARRIDSWDCIDNDEE